MEKDQLPVFGEIRPIGHHLLAHNDVLLRVMKVIRDI